MEDTSAMGSERQSYLRRAHQYSLSQMNRLQGEGGFIQDSFWTLVEVATRPSDPYSVARQ